MLFRSVVPQAILVVTLGIVTIIALVRWPKPGFLLAWFFLTLAPTSTIVPIATEVGAERRMYLPLMGLVVLGVIAVHLAARKGPPYDTDAVGRPFTGRRDQMATTTNPSVAKPGKSAPSS